MNITLETRTAPISFRIAPSLKASLEALAAKEDRSLSAMIEIILKRHVQALGD